jgi:OOP family OmpA-OmpF porin
MKRFTLPLVALIAMTGAAFAADARGCQDPPDLKRFERSDLVACAGRDYADYLMPLGKLNSWSYAEMKPNFAGKIDLAGRLRQRLYRAPAGPSASEVFQNYKVELEAKGYKTLFESGGLAFGFDQGRYFEAQGKFAGQLMGYSTDNSRVIVAEKEADGKKTHILVYVVEYVSGYHPQIKVDKGRVLVQVDTLESGDLTDRMQLVKAEDIGRGIEKDGKIAIYGILFDFNKSNVRPDSKPALEEIARYLKANPQRRLYVVGHTDAVGGFDSNLALSLARANAVNAALAKDHGIAPARLRAAGAGLIAPVASNADEAGRAKNRRVELVPQ